MGSTKYPLVAPPGGGTPSLPGTGQPGPMRPDEYQSGSVANVIKFGFDNVSPPSNLYIQRDDILLISGISSIAGEVVTVYARLLRVPEPTGGQPSDGGVGKSPGGIIERGVVDPVGFNLVLPAARTVGNLRIALAEGYLLSLSAIANTAVNRGQTFVRGFIQRAPSAVPISVIPLMGDYVTSLTAAGWPTGRVLSPIEGPGFKHSVNVANPAAGADWSLILAAFNRLRIESFNAVFTAAAAAANRNIQIVVDDGANVMGIFTVPTVVIATNVANVTGTAGSTNTSIIPLNEQVALPNPLILQPNWRLRSSTVGIQPADQWSAIWFNVEEYIEGI